MAFTVTTDLTNFDLAESATPWSTGALDPDFFVQGSNSVGFYMSKNARGSVTVNPTDISHAAGDHFYGWLNSSVAAKMEPQTTGTTTASGVTVRVTLANAAYREWHLAGSDTWDGGWRCFVMSLDHTGSHLYASSGTWTTASQIASITYYFDLSNSGNIRNVPANCWGDAIRFGTGVTAYNTSAADASFDFTDIAAACEASAQAYGVTETKDGVVFLQGKITVGDQSGSNHLDFDSQDEIVVFSLRDGTDGFGLVDDALYVIQASANATGTDQDFNMGVKVGTGDAATGRNGTQILAGASTVRWRMLLNDADYHNKTMYGCTIRGAYVDDSTIGFSGGGNATVLEEFSGNTWDACGKVDFSDTPVRNCNILNANVLSTSGAITWANGTTDVEYCLFVNNPVAVEVVTLSADMTFTGMEFSGNTNDVRYEGATDWDLNWTDASGAPSIQNAGAGTLTAVNTVTLTLTNVVVGSQCAIYTDPGGTELMNETAVSTTVTEPYAFSSTQDIIVRVRNSSGSPRYFPYNAGGQITSDGFTLRIDQVVDTIAS